MKCSGKIASVAMLLIMAACGPAGYYDSTGKWHTYNEAPATQPVPGAGAPVNRITTDDGSYTVAPPAGTTTVIQYQNNTAYTRAGFYDHNGYPLSNGPQVPSDYWPPRGMCRVWFAERAPDQQPPVESCDGIQTRVPLGAYVVYGG